MEYTMISCEELKDLQKKVVDLRNEVLDLESALSDAEVSKTIMDDLRAENNRLCDEIRNLRSLLKSEQEATYEARKELIRLQKNGNHNAIIKLWKSVGEIYNVDEEIEEDKETGKYEFSIYHSAADPVSLCKVMFNIVELMEDPSIFDMSSNSDGVIVIREK